MPKRDTTMKHPTGVGLSGHRAGPAWAQSRDAGAGGRWSPTPLSADGLVGEKTCPSAATETHREQSRPS